MFIVLRVKNCPEYIRGYLQRFLSEPDSDLFIGNVSKRVYENFWERITQSEENLQAYLIVSVSENEQGFIYRHNGKSGNNFSKDFDGITLFGRKS